MSAAAEEEPSIMNNITIDLYLAKRARYDRRDTVSGDAEQHLIRMVPGVSAFIVRWCR